MSRIWHSPVSIAGTLLVIGFGLQPLLAAPPASLQLELDPQEVVLAQDDGVQWLATAVGSDGHRRDVTRQVDWKVTEEGAPVAGILKLTQGWGMARSPGAVSIVATFNDPLTGQSSSAVAKVTIAGGGQRPLTSFAHDILPILSKAGCNGGNCHGRAIGQNGFKLSLYGFDAQADYDALVNDGLGRRVSPAAPTDSLILRKATGNSPHGGGVRLSLDSDSGQRLQKWIAEGMPDDGETASHESRLEVAPAELIGSGRLQQQLRVTVQYSDGTRRDITPWARFDTQQPELLSVSPDGYVETTGGTGEGHVMVRYQARVAVVRVIIRQANELPESAYASFQPRNPIDEHVLRKWRDLRIAPSLEASDAEFLRRLFLTLLGTLPTPDEVRAFTDNPAADKRVTIVDQVLQRDEYIDFSARRLGDLLRNRVGDSAAKDDTVAFAKWIRDAVAANRPYDQIVREVLGATGKRSDNPQLDWYRWANSPENRVEDTAQAFLGLRMSCANCHNHPFEAVSQTDYWQFGAFFARTKSVGDSRIDELKLNDEGELKHPRTGKVLSPRALGGAEFPYVKGEDPRQKLLDWMLAADNPYFARAICNRIWGEFFGVGLVDPVDDLRATNPASNPQLLDALAVDFVNHQFDLKHLVRQIATSRAFGLASSPTENNRADRRNYARFYSRRLEPHVLLDAIAAATRTPLKFDDYPEVTRAVRLPNEKARSDFLEVFGRSERTTSCTCETRIAPNLPQVLFLLHSEELQRRIADPKGIAAELADSGKPPAEIVDALFLRTLSRMPTVSEHRDAVAFVESAEKRRALVEDLLWALLNSNEFLFNH